MPKIKTHKRAAAKFRITGTGKILRMKGGRNHLRRNKPAKVRRAYGDKLAVSGADKRAVRRLLPYGLR